MIPLLVPVGLGLIGGYLTKESKHQVFAEGGEVFSMSKTILEDGKLTEMVIAENVTVKEFDKLFSDKGYRKVYDNSLVGYYFVKPNGDTIQLIPSFHKKGEIEYAEGGGIAQDKEVSEERYYDMLGVVPPLYFRTLDGISVRGGFAVGEVYSHQEREGKFRGIYDAFYQKGNKYYQVNGMVYFISKDEAKRAKYKEDNEYAKGGKVRNYSYLPNDKISYLLTDDGNVIPNKDILDGAYIRGKNNYDNKYDNGGEIGEDGVVQYPNLSNIKPQVVNDIGELPIIDIVKLKSVKYIGDSIKSSMDSVDLMRNIYTPEILQTYEMAYAILLDNNNKPYYIYEHSKGSVNGTIMDVEMVCAAALKSLSKGVIVVHNHPSGNLQPSSADIRVTADMNKGLNSIGIKLLDSIIITKDGYKSFADEGMMPN
jgi:DNA repair protein RadC